MFEFLQISWKRKYDAMVQIFRVSFSSKSHNQSTQKENMGFLAAYSFQKIQLKKKDVLRLKKGAICFVFWQKKKWIADEKVSFSSEKDILSSEKNDFLGLCWTVMKELAVVAEFTRCGINRCATMLLPKFLFVCLYNFLFTFSCRDCRRRSGLPWWSSWGRKCRSPTPPPSGRRWESSPIFPVSGSVIVWFKSLVVNYATQES